MARLDITVLKTDDAMVLRNATGRGSLLLPFSVSSTGTIDVEVDGHPATITSTFTSMGQRAAFGGKQGGWRQPVKVDRSQPGRITVYGVNAVFSVDRLIVSEAGRLIVNDTIRVLRADSPGNATAVQQSHSATFGSAVNYSSIDGPNDEEPTECISASPGMCKYTRNPHHIVIPGTSERLIL